jgi:hypothetical protein
MNSMPPPEAMKVRKPRARRKGQKLEHRLVDELRVGALEAGMARRGQPVRDDRLELRHRHAGVGRHDQLDHAALARLRQGLHVPLERRLEGLLVLPFRALRRERRDAVEREGELNVHGLLDPERAVVVEGGDALGRGDEIGRAFPRHGGDEVQDGPLGVAVVPRWQRIGRLRLGNAAPRPGVQQGQRRQRRQDEAARHARRFHRASRGRRTRCGTPASEGRR